MRFKNVCLESIAVALPGEIVDLRRRSRSGCGPSTSACGFRSAGWS